jgi:hypothetical protein
MLVEDQARGGCGGWFYTLITNEKSYMYMTLERYKIL